MLVAKRENGEKVLATSDLENTKDFICRFCGRKVILKKGKIKSPHFAHKEKCECDYNEQLREKCGGESELHYKWKNKIKKEMEQLSYVEEVLLEERIGNRIADIVVVFNERFKDFAKEGICAEDTKRLIVEIQLSKISFEKIVERSKDYENHGDYNDDNIFWLMGEKYISTMGKYIRYITKDLTHFEYWDDHGDDIKDDSIIGIDEEGEWDIFTVGYHGLCTPYYFKENIEVKNFQRDLKRVNKFVREYKKYKSSPNTIQSLCELMRDGIISKYYEEEDKLLECRREYIKQRREYSKQYGISDSEIDNLVKDISESKEDFYEYKPYYTDRERVYDYWYYEPSNQTNKEKEEISRIARTIEKIEAIENNDTCKYIVDK